jgi:hypothetical protein
MDRNLCWELYDSSESAIKMYQSIQDKQNVLISTLDSTNLDLNHQIIYLLDEKEKLNKKLKRNRLFTISSSSISVLLIGFIFIL